MSTIVNMAQLLHLLMTLLRTPSSQGFVLVSLQLNHSINMNIQILNFVTIFTLLTSPNVSLFSDVLGELVSYHPMCEYLNGVKRTQIDLQDKE